jgi:uncharacterized protein YceK
MATQARRRLHHAVWFVLATGICLAGCETVASKAIDKSAQSDELRRESSVAVTLPRGCPTLTAALPMGRTSVSISYEEPSTNQDGSPLTNLAYTTIYLTSPQSQPSSIRIWTDDAHGGAPVTIRDVPIASQELEVCVTATNWAGKESEPGFSAKHRLKEVPPAR